MALQKIYALFGTLLLATSNDAADIQAELDITGDDNELLEMIFNKLEHFGNRSTNGTSISKSQTELASALLQVAPVITIKGNITDPSKRYTISFTVRASQSADLLNSLSCSDSDEDEEDDDRGEGADSGRGSGGVFHPLVSAVEPYFLSFAELLAHGVLSSMIGNFLESTKMIGDGRLV